MGDGVSRTSDHARAVVRYLDSVDAKDPGNAPPKGVPHHLAAHPQVCEDCGKTYWSRERWAAHLGCKGVVRDTGF